MLQLARIQVSRHGNSYKIRKLRPGHYLEFRPLVVRSDESPKQLRTLRKN